MEIVQGLKFDGRIVRDVGTHCRFRSVVVAPVRFDDGKCAILSLVENNLSQMVPDNPRARRALDSATEIPKLRYSAITNTLFVFGQDYIGEFHIEMQPTV